MSNIEKGALCRLLLPALEADVPYTVFEHFVVAQLIDYRAGYKVALMKFNDGQTTLWPTEMLESPVKAEDELAYWKERVENLEQEI